ncbi:MAG: HlyD family efflux transporter periplasmic adaptor subunit [Desulfobacteraceae bacterium]
MPKRLRIMLVVIVAAGATTAWWWTHRTTVDPHRLNLSGTIEVTQVELAFKIPGRLLERLVDEGDRVTAGQIVARLDDVDQKLQVARAQAQAAAAKALLAQLESGSRAQEVARARAQLQQAGAAAKAAESRLKLAQDDVARSKALRAQDVISQQKFDELQTVYETAFNSRRAAAAQVHSAKANLDLVVAGPRKEEIEQAQAQVAVAEQVLALDRQQMADTVLRSPAGGVVLSKSAEPGAYLNPGTPVITLGQLDRVWLRGYINETDLGRIRLHQSAQVTTDTYPEKVYPGKISFISDQAEFTPKAVQTYEERVKLMYRIKISLDNPRQELKAGMPADATIQLD